MSGRHGQAGMCPRQHGDILVRVLAVSASGQPSSWEGGRETAGCRQRGLLTARHQVAAQWHQHTPVHLTSAELPMPPELFAARCHAAACGTPWPQAAPPSSWSMAHLQRWDVLRGLPEDAQHLLHLHPLRLTLENRRGATHVERFRSISHNWRSPLRLSCSPKPTCAVYRRSHSASS